MSLLADWEIKKLSEEENMITPFVDHAVRERDGKKVLSYGLGSYGYDIRLSPQECLIFGGVESGYCDPKDFSPSVLKNAELHEDEKGSYFLLPPYGYCLGVAKERLQVPEDVTIVAVGKSTYARSGIMVAITPAEAMWQGYLTLEISNATGLWNRIYADEGICQLMFYRGKKCSTTYEDRKGKYQNQPEKVVFART